MIAPFVVVMILGSMLPSIDFDVLEYHLQGPKEYYQAGRIAFLPHNVYTSMPFGVEMLHLLAMEVMGDWWWGGLAGQLLVALFAPAAAVLIAATALRVGSARAAWFAAIVYLSTPWIYRLAVIAYVEGPLCFYHAALVWAAVRGFADRSISRRSIWCLIGLLAGCAMGCKYPALISAVIPLGALSLRRLQAEPIDCALALLRRGLGGRDGPVAGQERDRHRKPRLSAGQFHLPRPLLGPSPRDEMVTRTWPSARHGRRAGELGGRCRRPVRLAVAAVRGAGAAGLPSSRIAPAGTWALWGFVVYLFATWWLLDPPAGPVLAAALASAGGARGPGGRLGPKPRLVDPPGYDHDDRTGRPTSPTSRRPWPASTNGPATWCSCGGTSRDGGMNRSPRSTPSCRRTPIR